MGLAKRACDVWKCEVNRFFKLTKTSIIPVSFVVPRKSGADVFQEDIYPDTYAGKPALTADEWLKGANKEPITMSMDPEKRTDDSGGARLFKTNATYQELEAKLGISSEDDQKEDDEQKEDEPAADAPEPAADEPVADEPAAD